MLTLYSIRFYWRDNTGSLQPVLASAKNKKAAIWKARLFIASHYKEKIVLDNCQAVCKTPDNVIDWV